MLPADRGLCETGVLDIGVEGAEPPMAARKLAGSGTGDCLGGFLKAFAAGALCGVGTGRCGGCVCCAGGGCICVCGACVFGGSGCVF